MARTRSIYIRKQDIEIFERAEKVNGNLSKEIANLLRDKYSADYQVRIRARPSMKFKQKRALEGRGYKDPEDFIFHIPLPPELLKYANLLENESFIDLSTKSNLVLQFDEPITDIRTVIEKVQSMENEKG